MLTFLQTSEKLNKGFIKTGDLQRQLAALRLQTPDIKPIDAANALLEWFQHPDHEFVRLDVLYYAITHSWSTVTSKIDDGRPAHAARVRSEVKRKRAAISKRKMAVSSAVDEAKEQMVATMKHMTFKQARMLHGATANLDLGRGSDDQRLGDVFSEAEIRSALNDQPGSGTET